MAKHKGAARSDGRRAPSASASRKGIEARAKASASGKAKASASGKAKATGGPVVSRAKSPARPAKPGQSRRRTPPDDVVAGVPSSLNMNRRPSAARSGRAELEERYREHHETGPGMTAGDVDADWASAYSVGDEAPGGDNPTPGQAIVEDVGRALGVEYEDGEELKAADKIENRDRHRWELDPASSEDYPERTKAGPKRKR
jgi:hypothetical protein